MAELAPAQRARETPIRFEKYSEHENAKFVYGTLVGHLYKKYPTEELVYVTSRERDVHFHVSTQGYAIGDGIIDSLVELDVDLVVVIEDQHTIYEFDLEDYTSNMATVNDPDFEPQSSPPIAYAKNCYERLSLPKKYPETITIT